MDSLIAQAKADVTALGVEETDVELHAFESIFEFMQQLPMFLEQMGISATEDAGDLDCPTRFELPVTNPAELPSVTSDFSTNSDDDHPPREEEKACEPVRVKAD